MNNDYRPSELWRSIIKNNNESFNNKNLNCFRQIGNINNRLSSWDPIDKSTRYFKTLLMHFCWELDKEFSNNKLNFKDILSNIKNQKIGDPVTINYLGLEISLDYALCMEEILFLDNSMKEVNNIL